MTDSDDILRTLREMASNPDLTPSQRLRAIEQLERRAPPEPPQAQAPTDPETVMAVLIERLCPTPPELRDAPPDPMRDLDAAEQLRRAGRSRTVDPVIWTWLAYCPPRVADAERQILQAVRRLKLSAGPYPLPGAPAEDELEPRRRKRGA